MTGLTAKDFLLTEDSNAQSIRFFEFQTFDDVPPVIQVPGSLRPLPLPRLSHTQITPESPGDVRYRNRRLLALYFDLLPCRSPISCARSMPRSGSSALR